MLTVRVWLSKERNSTLTQAGLGASVLLDPVAFLPALCLSKINREILRKEPTTKREPGALKSAKGKTVSPRAALDLPPAPKRQPPLEQGPPCP